MSKTKPPCCGNCRYGEFERQKNGRINPQRAGQCMFVPVLPPLPLSITKAYGFREQFHKSYVWPVTEGCPVHEPKAEVT